MIDVLLSQGELKMGILEDLWGWFEDMDGTLKVLAIALMIALGGAGFMGISVVKDIFSPDKKQQQEEVIANKVGELQTAGEEALVTGQEALEDTKQKALDYAEEMLNKFKQ